MKVESNGKPFPNPRPEFTAEAEMIENEFDVELQGRFFRTREVL